MVKLWLIDSGGHFFGNDKKFFHPVNEIPSLAGQPWEAISPYSCSVSSGGAGLKTEMFTQTFRVFLCAFRESQGTLARWFFPVLEATREAIGGQTEVAASNQWEVATSKGALLFLFQLTRSNLKTWCTNKITWAKVNDSCSFLPRCSKPSRPLVDEYFATPPGEERASHRHRSFDVCSSGVHWRRLWRWYKDIFAQVGVSLNVGAGERCCWNFWQHSKLREVSWPFFLSCFINTVHMSMYAPTCIQPRLYHGILTIDHDLSLRPTYGWQWGNQCCCVQSRLRQPWRHLWTRIALRFTVSTWRREWVVDVYGF